MNENQNAFLNSRFTPATLPEVYAPRRELLSLLHKAAARHYVYVGAPAGSGKTVSALLWLNASGRKSVWIGLNEYDNAPAVFYKQLAVGIFSIQPDNEAMRSLLADPNFSATPVEHTIRLITEMRPDDTLCAIVLDDAHLVTNYEIIKSLPAVLERLPRTFVTLILSRNTMPDNFQRVIVDDSEISLEHLRFSPDEIRLYFQSLGRFLSPEEAQFAFVSTDGLAIGVNAVAMSGHVVLGKSASAFAQYFEDNIWNTWDGRTRDFCLLTSVLDEFTPDFAKRLTGYDDAPEIMEQLSRSNAFLSHMHEDVYRFHHLFQEFLRDQALRSDVDVVTLYKTAAEYYRENGNYSMALRFWLDSGDYKGVDKFLFLFMFENHHGDIAGYADFLRLYFIRDFPEKAFKEFPALHVCCAWYYYMTSQYKEYEYHADEGYKHIARIAMYNPKFVEFAMLMYSVDHRSEMLDKIKRFNAFGKLVKGITKEGIIRYIASCTHNLPYLHRSSFDYSEAAKTPENVKKIVKSAFGTLLGDQTECIASLAVVGKYYERSDLDMAFEEAHQLNNILSEHNSVELIMSVKFIRHSILLKLGRDEEANAALGELSEFVGSSAPFFSANLEAYKARMELQDCNNATARAWLDNYYVVDVKHIELYMVFQHFTTARAYMVLGDGSSARKYLTMLREFGLALNRVCDYCEASTLLAALEWAEGQKKEAEVVLIDALEKLQPLGYRRMIIDEGAAVLPILKRIALKTGKQGYIGRLSHGFVSECMISTYAFAQHNKSITDNIVKQHKPVKLSRQQKNIMTLLSKGYTNAMIVEETGLKISTIKTHTSLAYEKLNVNSAMDAVLKARELGLI